MKKDKIDTVCFTGHRPKDLGGYNEKNDMNIYVKRMLYKSIIACHERYGIINFISGLAQGVDQWSAEIVLYLKRKKRFDINLIGVKPFTSQHIMWNEKDQERFLKICDLCDELVTLQPDPYAPWKMEYRNKYMVKQSDIVIAVWKGIEGGTGNCVKFAKRIKKPILRINPDTKKIFWEIPLE